MLSKSRLSFLRSLRQKKYRAEQKLFVAEGSKLVNEILRSKLEIPALYATSKWIKDNASTASNAGEVITVDKDELSRISSLVTAADVLAVVRMPEHQLDINELKNELTLTLDGIRDPGNMGTIIRIADWFGINNIICSPDCAEIWNPKVVQASMGSLLRVKVHERVLPLMFADEDFLQLKLPVYGAFLDGENVYTSKAKTGIIVIGNEANGIEESVEKHITQRITIPAFQHSGSSENAESLNAAVATAIIVSEFRRKG